MKYLKFFFYGLVLSLLVQTNLSYAQDTDETNQETVNKIFSSFSNNVDAGTVTDNTKKKTELAPVNKKDSFKFQSGNYRTECLNIYDELTEVHIILRV